MAAPGGGAHVAGVVVHMVGVVHMSGIVHMSGMVHMAVQMVGVVGMVGDDANSPHDQVCPW